MGTGSPISQLISLAYPAGDVVIGTMILILASRAPRSTRLPLLILGGGLLANLLADSGFAYLTTTNAFGPGNPIDVGWIAGYLLIAIAAWRAMSTPSVVAADEAPPERIWLILPYAPVAAAALTATVTTVVMGRLDEVIFWSFMFVVTVVVVRQFLMLADNQRLTRQLESNTVALREREDHFRSLVQNSSDVITLIDRDGHIQYQSASVERIFGYGGGRLVGTAFGDLVDAEDRTQVLRRIQEAIHIDGPPISIECRLQREDGSFCPSEITITNLLHLPTVRGLVLNTRDISERRALEEKLTHQAFHDSLTNLPNRAAFRVVLDHAMHGGDERRIAVLFLDLDDFKTINDSLGHGVGDELLIAVAQRLRGCVREADTAARISGDEFAILLEDIDHPDGAARSAERILEALQPPFTLAGTEVFVRASIGIALGPLGSRSDQASELLRNADLAMYMAKSEKKGSYRFFAPGMHAGLLARLELKADLERALGQRDFTIHYQPIVSLVQGTIDGLEALIRWRHPTRGLMNPAEFLPLAEETGLVRPVGHWVLRESCRQGAEWQRRVGDRVPLTISVNLSPSELLEPELVQQVAAALRDSGLRPDRLILELTESVFMQDTEATLERLSGLKRLGVKLAIDDFGTGYSSLGYLQRFPLDRIKVAKQFVDDVSKGAGDSALTRAIIKLGETFELETVAEGIEQPAQLMALREIGCKLGQGHYFARALPAEDIGELLRDPTPLHRLWQPASLGKPRR